MEDLGRVLVNARNAIRAKITYASSLKLEEKSQASGAVVDSQKILSQLRRAVQLAPSNDRNRGVYLCRLGIRLADRYERTGKVSELEEAIFCVREAIRVAPADHPGRPIYINNLGGWLHCKYVKTGSLSDLEEAIYYSREATTTMSKNKSDGAGYLSNLGVCLCEKFQHLGKIADLEEAVDLSREAIRLTTIDHPGRGRYLLNLSNSLRVRFLTTGSSTDLEEAVLYGKEAFISRANHPKRATFANYLSVCLSQSFLQQGSLEVLDEAIHYGRESIKNTSACHFERETYILNLCTALFQRFGLMGTRIDLEEAIRLGRESVKTVSVDHTNRGKHLATLGSFLQQRFKETGEMRDLDEAIHHSRQAIISEPLRQQDRLEVLMVLSACLGARTRRTGRIEDLEGAISYSNEAIAITPMNNPFRAIVMSQLGAWLMIRFERIGCFESLEKAVHYGTEAIKKIPVDHPQLPGITNDLAGAFHYRFNETGSMADLEEAIKLVRDAITTTPNNRLRGIYLNNLGCWLGTRFARKGAIEDIEDAICYSREATKITPGEHPHQANILDILSGNLGKKYQTSGMITDLEEAIRYSRKGIKAISEDDPQRIAARHNLAIRLHDRFHRTGALENLEEAIDLIRNTIRTMPKNHYARGIFMSHMGLYLMDKSTTTKRLDQLEEAINIQQEAVHTMSQKHVQRPMCLNHLGRGLRIWFKQTGSLEALEEAVKCGKEVIKLTSIDHPSTATYMNTLGLILLGGYRNDADADAGSFEEARSYFSTALTLSNGAPLCRIWAGIYSGWLYLESSEWLKAFDQLQIAVRIVPRISPRSLALDDQQHALRGLAGLSSLAASAALQAGKTAAEAFELSEAGRGIIAGLSINSRNDVTVLGDQHPGLCSKYVEIRNRVSMPLLPDSHENVLEGSRRVDCRIQTDCGMLASEAIQQHQNNVQELDQVENAIRKLPGFDRFQLAPSLSDLTSLASRGTIISFNVTQVRGDAFLITNKDIRCIPLPDLAIWEAEERMRDLVGSERLTRGSPRTRASRNRRLKKTLQWLWDVAVFPVLRELNLLSCTKPKRLPRVFWVTSGHIGLAPIHAAGNFDEDSMEKTSSHVVSTYIPSLKGLGYARERNLEPLEASDQGVVIISMPKTDGMGNLQVEQEIRAIKRSFESFPQYSLSVLDSPSKATVLKDLSSYRVAHFACHGVSDPSNPSNGGLYLQGSEGRSDLLTIRELDGLIRQDAQIAYLSACSTAASFSLPLMDESIHLANTFHLIGFPHVIGTMWEADNCAAAKVAGIFYSELVRNMGLARGEDSLQDVVPYALHQAIQAFQEDRRGKSRRRGTLIEDIIAYAPFIHVGA